VMLAVVRSYRRRKQCRTNTSEETKVTSAPSALSLVFLSSLRLCASAVKSVVPVSQRLRRMTSELREWSVDGGLKGRLQAGLPGTIACHTSYAFPGDRNRLMKLVSSFPAWKSSSAMIFKCSGIEV